MVWCEVHWPAEKCLIDPTFHPQTTSRLHWPGRPQAPNEFSQSEPFLIEFWGIFQIL